MSDEVLSSESGTRPAGRYEVLIIDTPAGSQSPLTRIPWPEHLALSLNHNEHKNYYQGLSEYVITIDLLDDEWVSPEQRLKAFETDECWLLQWDTTTPVGFSRMAAADLPALIGWITQNAELGTGNAS